MNQMKTALTYQSESVLCPTAQLRGSAGHDGIMGEHLKFEGKN